MAMASSGSQYKERDHPMKQVFSLLALSTAPGVAFAQIVCSPVSIAVPVPALNDWTTVGLAAILSLVAIRLIRKR